MSSRERSWILLLIENDLRRSEVVVGGLQRGCMVGAPNAESILIGVGPPVDVLPELDLLCGYRLRVLVPGIGLSRAEQLVELFLSVGLMAIGNHWVGSKLESLSSFQNGTAIAELALQLLLGYRALDRSSGA